MSESLTELNLRLNRLADEGGRMLLEGISGTCEIAHLNLSGNSLAWKSAAALTRILSADDSSLLQSLDLSCNEFTEDDVEDIAKALGNNKVRTSDLQCTRAVSRFSPAWICA